MYEKKTKILEKKFKLPNPSFEFDLGGIMKSNADKRLNAVSILKVKILFILYC